MRIAELNTAALRQWIEEHQNDAPAQLMLQAHRFPGIPMREAVAQIQSRQKLRKKLPAWAQNFALILPPGLSAEQASSEETAAYKASLVGGASFADLTGGLGADTFALAARFTKGHYVEQQAELVELAAYNAGILKIRNLQFHHQTAEAFLAGLSAPLDLLYLDPARRDEANRKLVRLSDCQPDVEALLPELLAKGKQVLIKVSPMLDLASALRSFSTHVQAVHLLALRQELKEILFLLKKDAGDNPQIHALQLDSKSAPFVFTQAEEQTAEVRLSAPKAYLYEPHAALMKAAPYKLLTQRYNVWKLHPSSHLYTSDQLIDDFPGRKFKIRHLLKADRKALSKYLPDKKANLNCRNFPLATQALQQKLGIRDGGSVYLFATTLLDQKTSLLLCEKLSNRT